MTPESRQDSWDQIYTQICSLQILEIISNFVKCFVGAYFEIYVSKTSHFICLSQDKDRAPPKRAKKEDPHELKTTEAPQSSSALFFQYNTQLGPVRRIS